MNATEQRRQATVAQRVEQHVSDVTEVLDQFDARLFELASKGQEARRELNELLTVSRTDGARLNRLVQALDTLRSDNLQTHDDLWLHVTRLPTNPRTFWGRLRWLFTGR